MLATKLVIGQAMFAFANGVVSGTSGAAIRNERAGVAYPTNPAATAVSPEVTWTDVQTIGSLELGGMPSGSAFAETAGGEPLLIVRVELSDGSGSQVKALQRTDQGWGAPVLLGAASSRNFGEEDGDFPTPFFTANSAVGPAILWRSGDDEVTLARMDGEAWATSRLSVDRKFLEDSPLYTNWNIHRTESEISLWVRGQVMAHSISTPCDGTYCLSTPFWKWRQSQSDARPVDLPNLPASGPEYSISRFAVSWFDSSDTLHAAYLQRLESETDPENYAIVERRLSADSLTWSAPTIVAADLPGGTSRLQAINVAGVPGLIWQTGYPKDVVIQLAWNTDSSWRSQEITDGELYAAPTSTGGKHSCLLTQNQFWVVGPDQSPRASLAKPSRVPRPMWSYPRAGSTYLENIKTCAQIVEQGPGIYASTSSTGSFPQLIKNSSIYGASSGEPLLVTSISGQQLVTATLRTREPSLPGPVTDAIVEGKSKKRVLKLTLAWSPPTNSVYPAVKYQVRCKSGKTFGAWVDRGTLLTYSIKVAPDTSVTFHVRAYNDVGPSRIVKLTYPSPR